ncbi:hypothetical protein IPJ72_04400 [Candidatus Peregrinibacteria bacterium]|nr:MAG: hypothetical protein IPJ72_04400 [Candidatus Peregrinibacteria bacterium]
MKGPGSEAGKRGDSREQAMDELRILAPELVPDVIEIKRRYGLELSLGNLRHPAVLKQVRENIRRLLGTTACPNCTILPNQAE